MNIIQCNQCGTRYQLNADNIHEPVVAFRCRHCQHVFEVNVAAMKLQPQQVEQPQPKATMLSTRSHVVADEPETFEVLFAHGSELIRQKAEKILTDAQIHYITAAQGIEALNLVYQHKIGKVFVDHQLPIVPGEEFCTIVRRLPNKLDTRLVLITNEIPQQLLGSKSSIDDWIATAKLATQLVDKIKTDSLSSAEVAQNEPEYDQEDVDIALQPIDDVAVATTSAIDEKELTADLDDLLGDISAMTTKASNATPAEPQTNEEDATAGSAIERARRLARTIISDIALYNAEAIEEGLQRNTLHKLLAKQLLEGRALLEEKLANVVPDVKPYLDEALQNYIKLKKAENQQR